MQITLNQDEIEEALRNHVLNHLTIREDQEISIDLRAGRGENGYTATLDIRTRTREVNEPKQGPQLVADHWNEDEKYPVADWQYEVTNGDTRLGYGDWVRTARELAPAIEAEVPGPSPVAAPAATGPTPKAAARRAQAEAPKKGIFATASKPEAESDVPDQETPAQEGAREEIRLAAEEGGQEGDHDGDAAPAGQPESRKSIFTFGPKTSAG